MALSFFRGYGINQSAVAMESMLDELATKIGTDPFELRRKNMFVEGDSTITGQLLTSSVGAVETLDACRAALTEEWPTYQAMSRPGYRIGYGIAAHDCGVPINPQQIRGQLIGSVSMGQGYALSENYPSVNGSPPWSRINYRRLGVPTSQNATSVRVEVVEDPFAEGPYGAKGISETATVPSTPAILNAIHQATGVRVRQIPVDPKLLREAMAAS